MTEASSGNCITPSVPGFVPCCVCFVMLSPHGRPLRSMYLFCFSSFLNLVKDEFRTAFQGVVTSSFIGSYFIYIKKAFKKVKVGHG